MDEYSPKPEIVLRPKSFSTDGKSASVMASSGEDSESQIKEFLSEEAEQRDEITEELLFEIYDLEDDLSTLERRHGIQDRLQTILETFVDQDES